MNITIVTDSMDPADGPGRYSLNLVRCLASLVDRIDIAVPAGLPTTAGLPDACRLYPILPSRHLYYLRWPLFFPLVALKALQLVPVIRRSDLVHSVKDYPFSLIAALAARLCGRPFLTSAFGTFALIPLASSKHRASLQWVYRRAHRILCISGFTAERLRPLVERDKVVVLPTGVDPAFHDSGKPAIPHPRPFILSVGLVRARKGFDVSVAAFLSAARERPELDYLIVGGLDDEPYCQRLRSMLAEHPEGHRVHLIGRVDEDQLFALYSYCELFILTPLHDSIGRFEGLGLVYLEAGARAKAVIGSSDCGAEDAVEDGVTGILVPPDDIEATSEALRRLLADDATRHLLGLAGRERARGLTWEATACRVREIYADACS